MCKHIILQSFVEIGLQILIIFLGGRPLHVVKQGLTGIQWGIFIGFNAIAFAISIIIKIILLDTLLDKLISSKEKNPILTLLHQKYLIKTK